MIREILVNEFETIIMAYRNAVGVGLYLGLFFLGILYFWLHIKEENKSIKTFFGIYPIIILFLIFNPIFSKLLVKFVGVEVYWRVYWLLPLGIFLAYLFTKIIFIVSGKWKKFITFLSIFSIIILSRKIYIYKRVFQRNRQLL